MSALLSLPNELIDAILEALDHRPSLLTLAQTCPRLQTFVEARLFREIYIRDGPSTKGLARLLEYPPERAQAVQHLEVTPVLHAWRCIDQMPGVVGRMTRLKSLKVESPMINGRTRPAWWSEGCMGDYMKLLEGGTLRVLTSFTLHSHGTNNRFYNIDTILPVLMSSTLRYVHLSCVNLSFAEDSVAALNSQRARTPLETLIIQACVAPPGQLEHFQTLLSLPRALRSLTLILHCAYRNLGQQGTHSEALADAFTFLCAIQQQSNSLEHLRYTHRSNNNVVGASPKNADNNLFSSLAELRHFSPGLSPFTRLHTFDVGYDCNLADLLLDKTLAPPNLHTLRLTDIPFLYHYSNSWHPHLAADIAAIASTTPFSHLSMHTESCRNDFPFVADIYKTGPPRETLLRIADALENRASVQLVCAYYRVPYYAPFLHTEKMPDEAVVFDSRRPWSAGEGGRAQWFKAKRYSYKPPIACGEFEGWRGPFSGLGASHHMPPYMG